MKRTIMEKNSEKGACKAGDMGACKAEKEACKAGGKVVKVAVFASGEGTNAEAIAKYFAGRDDVEIAALIVNRSAAGAIARMERYGVPHYFFGKEQWWGAEKGGRGGADVVRLMQELGIDVIALAGFLPIVPTALIEAFPGRIANIHPSLLPKHGGKGMWGMHVHEAVLADGDKESGITVHLVSDEIDGGEILVQAKCPVLSDDTPDTLAARVHKLEHEYFPPAIERLAKKAKKTVGR